MTANQYKACIAKLGLTQQQAGLFFGLSLKTSQRYANGYDVPQAVAMLLAVMIAKRMTPEQVERLCREQ